jgi:hypothetical protein
MARGAPAACPAAVVVTGGPAALVTEVRAALTVARVQPMATPGCEAVQVTIEGGAEDMLLRVRDPAGRTSVRRMASARAAAALIESWTRSDLTDGLMRRPVVPPTAAEPIADASPTPTSRAGRATGQVAGETAVGSDGSAWLGGTAGVCLAMGRICLGPAARFAAADGRRALDGLLAARLPIALGGLTLAPGLAVGYGWHHRAADLHQLQADQQLVGVVGETGPVSSHGPRLEGELSLSIPLGASLALELRTGLGGAPQVEAGPRLHLRGGLGLRVGGP